MYSVERMSWVPEALRRALGQADDIERRGYSVAVKGRLADAIREMDRIREKYKPAFPEEPPPSRAEVAAKEARGELLTVEEAFAQARGISVEEDRGLVEEHKAKRASYSWE
jgi:hypothetical protein